MAGEIEQTGTFTKADRRGEQCSVSTNAAFDAVLVELHQATEKFGPFASAHEGYAVILEELDELWHEVKHGPLDRQREEAVQVAAMALRFLIDIAPFTEAPHFASTTHTRTSTNQGPDYCAECSEAARDWVKWPCSDSRERDWPAEADDCSHADQGGPLTLGQLRQLIVAQIDAQREIGWPDSHPEDICHRCGGVNVPSWWVDSDRFNTAMGAPAEHQWQGIVCPGCFVHLHEKATGLTCTWMLVPDPRMSFRWIEPPSDSPGGGS